VNNVIFQGYLIRAGNHITLGKASSIGIVRLCADLQTE
jgi:hypothetical protein